VDARGGSGKKKTSRHLVSQNTKPFRQLMEIARYFRRRTKRYFEVFEFENLGQMNRLWTINRRASPEAPQSRRRGIKTVCTVIHVF
jgi:hypothetical protein